MYCPFDGKRLRLRNVPVKNDPSVELELVTDERCRVLTTDLVYTANSNQDALAKTTTKLPSEPCLVGLNMALRVRTRSSEGMEEGS